MSALGEGGGSKDCGPVGDGLAGDSSSSSGATAVAAGGREGGGEEAADAAEGIGGDGEGAGRKGDDPSPLPDRSGSGGSSAGEERKGEGTTDAGEGRGRHDERKGSMEDDPTPLPERTGGGTSAGSGQPGKRWGRHTRGERQVGGDADLEVGDWSALPIEFLTADLSKIFRASQEKVEDTLTAGCFYR